VIPDDSPIHEPDIGIDESDVSSVDSLVGSPSLIGPTPPSPSGISIPLFVNKSSPITYHLFTLLDFDNSRSDF
jgi:hypothetical protein